MTTVEKLIERIKNNKALAIIIVFGVIVISIDKFSSAAKNLFSSFNSDTSNHYTNKVKDIKEQADNKHQELKKGAKIDFDIEQATIARIKREKQPSEGTLGLLIYSMTIVNSSKEAITIKEALLEFDYEGKHYSETAFPLITGIVHSKLKNESYPSLLFNIGRLDTLYMLGWYNIREQIAKGILLQPGAILQGSGFYLLPIIRPDDFNKIQNLSIKVVDYLGNSTVNPVNIEENDKRIILNLIQKKFEHTGQ